MGAGMQVWGQSQGTVAIMEPERASTVPSLRSRPADASRLRRTWHSVCVGIGEGDITS